MNNWYNTSVYCVAEILTEASMLTELMCRLQHPEEIEALITPMEGSGLPEL